MTARLGTVLALLPLLSAGCSLLPLEGDRLFQANRLEDAAASYRNYLDRHSAETPRGERALYRLGLIYALPESPLHDTDRAEQALGTLARQHRESPYGRQAALILSMQREVSILRQSTDAQAELAATLEAELDRLEEEAQEASAVAGEQQGRAQRLATEIGALKAEMDRLNQALEQKRVELERIKEIDLGRRPD